jgi:hypothetical protein
MWRLMVAAAVPVFASGLLYGQPLAGAQGQTGSVSAWGIEALEAHPAGLLQGNGAWEVALPALSAGMLGMTLREYAFFFGGVETPSGWQHRRLTPAERVNLAHLLEREPLAVQVRTVPLALVWRQSQKRAIGAEVGSALWARIQLPQGAVEAARQPVLGADSVLFRGGTFSVRLYSRVTAAYAQRLWTTTLTSDTTSPWRLGELSGGVAVHLYRGHVFVELLPGGELRLQPFVPVSWDSTVNWLVTVRQQWQLADAGGSWLAMLAGVAPSTGWGVGGSIGVRWAWKPADTAEPSAEAGISLEQLGFIRWQLVESLLTVEGDTVTGILSSVWDALQARYTPQRVPRTQAEATPALVRLGGALRLPAIGLAVPIRVAAECGYGIGAAWALPGVRGGIGVLFQSPWPWVPWLAAGAYWNRHSTPRITAGLRWSPPHPRRVRTVVDITTGSLTGWLSRDKVRSAELGMRVWLWL